MADITGTGIDIVDIAEIHTALSRWGQRWKSRVFTPAEISECDSAPDPLRSYSARFAAKEAAIKALPSDCRVTSFRDIEILRSAAGKPSLSFSPETTPPHGAPLSFFISISHSTHSAAAVVIVTSP